MMPSTSLRCWSSQVEEVGNPPSYHAGQTVYSAEFGSSEVRSIVLGLTGSDEYAGSAFPQRQWRNTGIFDRSPGSFQEEAVLGIHATRFSLADSEERHIESTHVTQESVAAGHILPSLDSAA
jgi:hypothetical protein